MGDGPIALLRSGTGPEQTGLPSAWITLQHRAMFVLQLRRAGTRRKPAIGGIPWTQFPAPWEGLNLLMPAFVVAASSWIPEQPLQSRHPVPGSRRTAPRRGAGSVQTVQPMPSGWITHRAARGRCSRAARRHTQPRFRSRLDDAPRRLHSSMRVPRCRVGSAGSAKYFAQNTGTHSHGVVMCSPKNVDESMSCSDLERPQEEAFPNASLAGP